MDDDATNQVAEQVGLKERLPALLRRILSTGLWMLTTYFALGLAMSHYLGAQYRAAGKPLWMDFIGYAIIGGAAVFVLILGIRRILPGGSSWRGLMFVTVAIVGSAIVAFSIYDSGRERIVEKRSPELEASTAEINRLLSGPLFKELGFTKSQVVKMLSIDAPLVKDPNVQNEEHTDFAGHSMVGYNRSAKIEVSLRGPDDNLWHCGIFALVDRAGIEGGQLSHQLIKAFLNKAAGPDAWPWVVAQYKLNVPASQSETRSDRTFGKNVITLRIAKDGGAFDILFLPGK